MLKNMKQTQENTKNILRNNTECLCDELTELQCHVPVMVGCDLRFELKMTAWRIPKQLRQKKQNNAPTDKPHKHMRQCDRERCET